MKRCFELVALVVAALMAGLPALANASCPAPTCGETAAHRCCERSGSMGMHSSSGDMSMASQTPGLAMLDNITCTSRVMCTEQTPAN